MNRYMQSFRKLICVSKLHKRILDSSFENSGLTPSSHRVLMFIARHGSKSQVEIAKAMDISGAAVAGSIKKLEADGYIYRTCDNEDSRFNNVFLTEKGEELVKDSRKIFELVDTRVFNGFSDEEMDIMDSFLARMEENLKD